MRERAELQGGRESDGRAERIFDLVIWVLIASAGIVAAYVCFGILRSEATGRLREYSVGGAIAGALVSWGVLTSVYLQLKGSSDELRGLRHRARELEQKLIRGAPRPQGFETEVDERQRVVLARPKDWQPKGGTILELEARSETMRPEDTFAAYFRFFFVPLDRSTSSAAEYYEKELKALREAAAYWHGFSHEMVRLGGDLSGVESLKLIIRQFVRTELKTSPETGQVEREWNVVSREEATGRITYVEPPALEVGRPQELRIVGFGMRHGAVCYLNGERHQLRLVGEGEALVALTAEEVAHTRPLEVAVENPETGGLRSNSVIVLVAPAGGGRESADELGVEVAVEAARPLEAAVAEHENPSTSLSGAPERVVIQEVARMRVVCYHEALERVYYFDFWDDVADFRDSSGVFNRVLASTRFLD
jgi:hypothetical protein